MPGTRRRSKTPGWVAIAALALVVAASMACGLGLWEPATTPESTTQEPIDAGTVDELLSAADREGFAANYSIRGRTRLYERDYEMAVSDFDMAVELESDNPRYYLNRALAYSFMGEDDLARGDVRRAAQLSNTRPFGVDGPDCEDGPTSLEDAYSVSIYRAYNLLFHSYVLDVCSPNVIASP